MKLKWIDGEPNAWDFVVKQIGRIIDEDTGNVLVYLNQTTGVKYIWAYLYLPGISNPHTYFLTVEEAQRTMMNYKGLYL